MHKLRPFSHVSVSSEQLPAPGLLAGVLPKFSPGCRAFSRALKIEKLKAPLFPGPGGAGDANDWCITECNWDQVSPLS